MLVVLTGAVLLPADAPGADCLLDGDRLVKRTGLVTVVQTREFQHVACLRTDGRRTELDEPDDDVTLEREHGIRISGHFVSYITQVIFPAGEDDGLGFEVTDALRSRTWTAAGATNCAPAADWVINGRGSVAWIDDCGSRPEVWRCLQPACDDPDTSAAERLDRGRIEPRSLRRRGDRVTWLRSGTRRSASFR
ncbi:MAG TPA: hypothetical protein VF712_08645 [Thermoleophilaceae bacterium]